MLEQTLTAPRRRFLVKDELKFWQSRTVAGLARWRRATPQFTDSNREPQTATVKIVPQQIAERFADLGLSDGNGTRAHTELFSLLDLTAEITSRLGVAHLTVTSSAAPSSAAPSSVAGDQFHVLGDSAKFGAWISRAILTCRHLGGQPSTHGGAGADEMNIELTNQGQCATLIFRVPVASLDPSGMQGVFLPLTRLSNPENATPVTTAGPTTGPTAGEPRRPELPAFQSVAVTSGINVMTPQGPRKGVALELRCKLSGATDLQHCAGADCMG